MESSVSAGTRNGFLGHRQPSSSSTDQTDRPHDTENTSYSIERGESFAHCRTNSDTSARTDDASYAETDSPFSWPAVESPVKGKLSRSDLTHRQDGIDGDTAESGEFLGNQYSCVLYTVCAIISQFSDTELEMMKEKFSKLLLGEDMSGSGKGVCTAATISNAITNLYASVFGQHQKLEPLNLEKKFMWNREMECLLSVCDYIVEFTPSLQRFKDGTTLEVMTSRPRSDIYINLPALKKLDAMLQNILDSFEKVEFWYSDKGSSVSGNLIKQDKWWLPIPCVSLDGLSEKCAKLLCQRRDCANQIHKAAMAINSTVLAEMHIPEPYITSLPKSGKASVGDTIYRLMYNAETFSPDNLLDCVNIRSEHEVLELADKVEASMYTWRRKACIAHSKQSWEMVKELMLDADKRDKNHVLAERAETLLLCLKRRYPELSQTCLDTTKIQYNTDVGQAILESYSRVLEGLAFNIVSWIEDVLFIDTNVKKQD